MILAGIDIGTNTLRLLVAETTQNSFSEIYSDRRITRLGQNLDRTGSLSPEAQKRSLDALLEFVKSITHYNAISVAAVGTSALRNASNSAEYIAEVKRKTGIAVSVITGEEEARLTLLGVAQTLKSLAGQKSGLPESTLIIDIGGGSTEIIITTQGEKPFIASLSLGAVYLTERFIRHDPPAAQEIESLRSSVRELLGQSRCCSRLDPAPVFIGTAGTITTLAAIEQRLVQYDPSKINGYTMTKDTIDGIVEKLIASTIKERKAMPGLEHGREDIILAGAVITQEIMMRFGFSTIIVSDWGLREGIVLDLYDTIITS